MLAISSYGADDELGTLNRLSDEVVQAAVKEVTTGVRINLDWPLDAQADLPFFGRQQFHKEVYQKPPRIVNDDVWTFNTQSSSQWDGLRHFAYQVRFDYACNLLHTLLYFPAGGQR